MNNPLSSAQKDAEKFMSQFETVVLATTGADGQAEASYAPYVRTESGFLIYVSELAPHTQNLLQYGHAALLFLEQETSNAQAFALKRLSFKTRAHRLDKASAEFSEKISPLHKRHASMMDLLLSLPDFHAFELIPSSARWISGFASTFISDTGRLQDLTPYTRS